ncbi:WD and tetratricopeptide repeats protein 1, partial [Geodia barretti]
PSSYSSLSIYSLLASGSDDLTAIVWDPLAKKQLASLPTGHTGNIFSVKFVPFSGDNQLLTGAEDKEVRLHDITSMETTRVSYSCT